MTEEPGNKYGSFYGNPDGVAPGLPPPKGGPEGHPCATLFAAKEDSDGKNGGRGRKLLVGAVVLLLLGGAGAGFWMLGGKSMLTPRGARASESPEQVRAVDQARVQTDAIRAQLQQYRAQHDGQSPTLGRLQDDWEVMVRKTYRDGSLVPDGPALASLEDDYARMVDAGLLEEEVPPSFKLLMRRAADLERRANQSPPT